MVPVARRNLLAEKGRLAISVAGVAFAVLLISIVLALYRGWSRSGATIEALPGDLWVVQEGMVDPFHSQSLIEVARVESLRGIEGVAAVTPVLARQTAFDAGGTEGRGFLMALGVPDPGLAPPDLRERFLPSAGQISIDGRLSQKTGLGRGDRVRIGDQELTVGTVTPRGSEALSSFVFLNFEDARRIFGVPGMVNYAILTLAPGADPEAVAARARATGPRLDTFTRAGFAAAIRAEIDESFIPVIALLTVIGFVVGAAVVGLTIYTATIERSREYGVMKAVGASGGFLYRIVMSQSAMLTALGFVVGVLAAWGIARLASDAVPEFVTEFRWADILGVLLATALMSVIAAFVPVRRLNTIDPAEVFRA